MQERRRWRTDEMHVYRAYSSPVLHSTCTLIPFCESPTYSMCEMCLLSAWEWKCFSSSSQIEGRFDPSSRLPATSYRGAVPGAEIFHLCSLPTPSWLQLNRECSKVGEPAPSYHLACIVALLWEMLRGSTTFARPWLNAPPLFTGRECGWSSHLCNCI